jgi:hypothetical protein
MDSQIIEPPNDDRLRITLKRAPDDPPKFGKEYQDGLKSVLEVFRAEGVQIKPRYSTRDSTGPSGGLSGEIIVFAKTLGPVVLAVLTAWLTARNGRKMSIKVDGIEVEAHTVKDVERLLLKAQEIKQKNEPSRIQAP